MGLSHDKIGGAKMNNIVLWVYIQDLVAAIVGLSYYGDIVFTASSVS